MNLRSLCSKLFYFIVCPAILISYLLEPLFDDIHIFLGSAKVTALTPEFPMNLDAVWESRFISHRFLYYILNLVSPFDDPFYSIWIKLLVAIPTILILYYFSKRLSERMNIPFHYPFTIGFLGLFAVNIYMILCSEYISVVIAMLMLTMLLDNRRWLWFASGLLVFPLITMKGLPVLLVPIIIFAVLMLVSDYKKRIYTAIYSLPLVFVSLLAMTIYFPHFISDIFLVTHLSHIERFTLLQDPFLVIQFLLGKGMGMIGFVPVIVIGFFTLFGVLSVTTKDNVRVVKWLLLMWIVASVYVLIISEFFYQHYYLMLIPAILTICYFFKFYHNHEPAFIVIIILILIIFSGLVSFWSLNGFNYKYASDRNISATAIKSKFDVMTQPVTLFYDYGFGAYYFPTRSACRYVGPLPYERHMPDWNMNGTLAYWEILDCTMSYTGKYVIVDDDWAVLDSPTHSELANKLNTEYTKVYTDYWDLYQRTETINATI